MKLKFICLNLFGIGELLDKALAFLIKEKPDIVALQEVYDGQQADMDRRYRALTILKKELDLKHYFYSPTFTDNRKECKIVQGNTIFSRRPIQSSKTIFFDIPYNKDYLDKFENYPYVPRNLQHVTIQSAKTKLNVFNTQGIWGLDGVDNERRLKMSQTIIKQIKDKENVILAGDFNLKPNTKTIQNIEKYLNNIFKNELNTSFNMRRKGNPGYTTAVVDFIFVSPNIKVIEHQCPQVDISDHLPLVCVLKV